MAKVRTIEDFLRQCKGKKSTRDHYETVLKIEERLLGKPLVQATEDDIASLKENRLRRMASGPQIAKILRMFYRGAGRKRLVEILALKETETKLRREDILTRLEVMAMIERGANSIRDRALIALLYELGVRVDSLLAVKIGDLPIRDGKVCGEPMPENGGRVKFRIWIAKTKDGIQHYGYVVELAPFLVDWLKEHPNVDNLDAPLFPSGRKNGKPLGERGCLDLVKKAYCRAVCGKQSSHTWEAHSRPDGEGAPPAGPRPKRIWNHLFRHTRTTHLLVLGVHPSKIKQMLGWAPGSNVLEKRYGHLVDRDAENAYLEALGLKVADKAKLEDLTYDAEKLRPVLALVPIPGERGPRTVKGEIDATVREQVRIEMELEAAAHPEILNAAIFEVLQTATPEQLLPLIERAGIHHPADAAKIEAIREEVRAESEKSIHEGFARVAGLQKQILFELSNTLDLTPGQREALRKLAKKDGVVGLTIS